MVAYNVESAVDTTNHLIVAHEVTNVGTDRSQLAAIAQAAQNADNMTPASCRIAARNGLIPTIFITRVRF